MPAAVTRRSWLRVAAAMTGVGWGANQFASMLLVYRLEDGLIDEVTTAMLAAYVGGIVPGLLIAAWVSAHIGKRRVMRPLMVIGVAASVAMVLGARDPGWLFVGRVLAGAAAGGAMGPGTAWIKELCLDAPAGTGARRAAVSLTGGFAVGPFVAALVAGWGPWWLGGSQVAPYLVHLVVMLIVSAAVWGAPELDRSDHPTPSLAEVGRQLRSPWFTRLLLPNAPWVFVATNTAFVVLPLLLAPAIGGTSVVLSGVAALGTMGTGILVQPWVKRIEARNPGVALPAGMLLLAFGLGLAVPAYLWQLPWMLLITTPVFGASYGATVVAGLQLVERHSSTWLLAPMTAVFYSLAYCGFVAPLIMAALARVIPMAVVLGGTGVLALMVVLFTFRRSLAEGASR